MPSSRTQLTGTRARRAARSRAPSTPRRGAATGERSQNGRSRPTSSSDSAHCESPLAAARPRPAGQRERAQVIGRAGVDALLGAGGDQPDVAARVERAQARRQRGQHAQARGVSLAPGAGGALSVCAIAMRRQVAGVSSEPITLRERPRPGTSKLLDRHAQAGRAEARARSAGAPAPRPALGRRPRAPRREMRTRAGRGRTAAPGARPRIAQESSRSSSCRLGHRAPCRRSARRRTRRRGRPRAAGPRSSGTPSGSPPASTRCGRKAPRTTRSSASRSSPTSATSLTGARWKSSAWSRWPNACGCLRRELVQQPQHAHRPLARSSCSPVRAARRSRPYAALDVARRGSGGPRGPCGAPAAARGPSEVSKKPPVLVVGEALDHRVGERRAPRRTSAARSSPRRA